MTDNGDVMRGAERKPRTELGKMLMALRQEYVAAGGRLLSADEIDMEKTMPWYTTADARRDAEKQQRRLRYKDVERRCWKCGIGEFELMLGSDYLWQCNHCEHIGQLKIVDAPGNRHGR